MASEKLTKRRRGVSVQVDGLRVVLHLGDRGRCVLTGVQALQLAQALQDGAAAVALEVARDVTVGEIFDAVAGEISKRRKRA